MKIVLAILIGIFLILSIIYAPDIIDAIKKHNQFNQAFSAYASSLERKDYSKTYEICSPEFQDKISYDTFVEIHTYLESNKGKLINIEKGRMEVSGTGSPRKWTAVLNTKHVYQHDACSFRYTFHLINGKWKLFAMKQLMVN